MSILNGPNCLKKLGRYADKQEEPMSLGEYKLLLHKQYMSISGADVQTYWVGCAQAIT